MRPGTTSVNHTLRSAFAIEALQLLNQLHVLQQHRSICPRRLRILVVADRSAIIAREITAQSSAGEYCAEERSGNGNE